MLHRCTCVLAVAFLSTPTWVLPVDPPQSGLSLWLDAGDVDADGTPDELAGGAAVASWVDKIGGLVFEQSDPDQQPVSGAVDGVPTVVFDGLERTDPGIEFLTWKLPFKAFQAFGPNVEFHRASPRSYRSHPRVHAGGGERVYTP